MDWQDATIDTIKRFQAIHALAPETDIRALYPEARMITVALGVDDKRFWNVYLNVLRILVLAESSAIPDKATLFDAPTSRSPQHEDRRPQCPKKGKADDGEIERCELPEGHGGKHTYQIPMKD